MRNRGIGKMINIVLKCSDFPFHDKSLVDGICIKSRFPLFEKSHHVSRVPSAMLNPFPKKKSTTGNFISDEITSRFLSKIFNLLAEFCGKSFVRVYPQNPISRGQSQSLGLCSGISLPFHELYLYLLIMRGYLDGLVGCGLVNQQNYFVDTIQLTFDTARNIRFFVFSYYY